MKVKHLVFHGRYHSLGNNSFSLWLKQHQASSHILGLLLWVLLHLGSFPTSFLKIESIINPFPPLPPLVTWIWNGWTTLLRCQRCNRKHLHKFLNSIYYIIFSTGCCIKKITYNLIVIELRLISIKHSWDKRELKY